MFKIDEIVINLIKNAMSYKGITVSQLAEKTGLRPAQITTQLNGNIRLSFDAGIRMAIAVDVDIVPLLKTKVTVSKDLN